MRKENRRRFRGGALIGMAALCVMICLSLSVGVTFCRYESVIYNGAMGTFTADRQWLSMEVGTWENNAAAVTVSNGEGSAYATDDIAFSLELTVSAGIKDASLAAPFITTKDASGNDVTYTGYWEEITDGSVKDYSCGSGWVYRFYSDSGSRETTFTLDGGRLSQWTGTVSVELPDSVSEPCVFTLTAVRSDSPVRVEAASSAALIVLPTESETADTGILAEGGQTVYLNDWVISSASDTHTVNIGVQAEAKTSSPYVVPSVSVDQNGSATLTLALSDAAQSLFTTGTVAAQTLVGMESETDGSESGTETGDNGGEDDGSGTAEEGTEEAASGSTETNSTGNELSTLDGQAAEIYLTSGDYTATIHVTLRTQEATEEEAAGALTLKSSLGTLEKETCFAIQLPNPDQSYTISVYNKTQSAEVTGVRYIVSSGTLLAWESGSCPIPTGSDVVQMDFSGTSVTADDELTITVRDAAGYEAVLSRTVTDTPSPGAALLTEGESVSCTVTDESCVSYTMEQLTINENHELTWETVSADGLTLTVASGQMTAALPEGSTLAAGTYRLTIGHTIGTTNISWREIPLFIHYPEL